VPSKAERVASFHKETVKASAELVAAAGLERPADFRPDHFMQRAAPDRAISFAELYSFLAPGELLSGTDDPYFRAARDAARPGSFAP
jgi:hypothetical protein